MPPHFPTHLQERNSAMGKFEYTSPEHSEDRVYARPDDIFDVSMLRVEEGLAVHACDSDEPDLLAMLAMGQDFLTGKREEQP
jgi:hypothetical protein